MRRSSEQPLEVASPAAVLKGNGRMSPVAASPTAEKNDLWSLIPSRSPQPVLRQQDEDGSQGQSLPLTDGDAATAHRSSDPAPMARLSGAAKGQGFELGAAIEPVVPTSAPGALGLGVASSDSGNISQVQGPASGSKMATAAAAFSRRGGRRRK